MKLHYFLLPVLAAAGAACSRQAAPAVQEKQPEGGMLSYTPAVMNSKPVGINLPATAFKMTGDYARNVAVTLGSDGSLAYYPAPTDVSSASAAVEIGDGWWLNRQGLGPNSVFTKWTFAEYAALPAVPSQAEIIAAIIPGARVTEFRQLPMPASEAASMPAGALLPYLK